MWGKLLAATSRNALGHSLLSSGPPLLPPTIDQVRLLFSDQAMSHSLRPHGLQHASLPWPAPSLGACSNSCPVSQQCPPTISSSVTPFFSCPQSFPASRSFPMSWFFPLGGHSTGASTSASASTSVLPGQAGSPNMCLRSEGGSGMDTYRPLQLGKLSPGRGR